MYKYIKLSKYAERMDLHYKTAWRHWHRGKLKGYQDKDTGTIFVLDENEPNKSNTTRAILYARVSSSTNKASLDAQLERMRSYAIVKGYTIIEEKKEIASGLNDSRKQFSPLLKRTDYDVLIVEHKDRLTRFGFEYIKQALNNNNVELDVINHTNNKDNELVDDFVSIITSFCDRIYGRKRKAKTKQIIETLEIEKGD